MADIKDIREDARLLAPNGNPSNLPSELWHYVRTPEFKAWFGDWENSPETGSQVLDGNGEPLLVWHGSNREFDAFNLSRAGENTGGGEWTDRNTGEKVADDSTKAVFFSSLKAQAVSYSMLAQYNSLQEERRKVEGLIPIFNAMTNYDFRDREECLAAMRSVKDSVPGMTEVLAAAEGDPERKITSDIVASLPEGERRRIADALREQRRSLSEREDIMRRGGLSNMYNNNVRQILYVESLKRDMDRLRRNDLDVRTEFGTFREYNVTIFGSGNKTLSLFDEKGRIWFSGEGRRFALDSASDGDISWMVSQIDRYVDDAVRDFNETAARLGYEDGARLYGSFLNIRTPLAHDYEESPYMDTYKKTDRPTGYVTARQVRKALSDGNDGVIYNNIRDPFVSDTYGVFDTGRIMLAVKENTMTLDRGAVVRGLADAPSASAQYLTKMERHVYESVPVEGEGFYAIRRNDGGKPLLVGSRLFCDTYALVLNQVSGFSALRTSDAVEKEIPAEEYMGLLLSSVRERSGRDIARTTVTDAAGRTVYTDSSVPFIGRAVDAALRGGFDAGDGTVLMPTVQIGGRLSGKHYPEFSERLWESVQSAEAHHVTLTPFRGAWSRDHVEDDSQSLYVFTDNTDRDSGRGVVSRRSRYYATYGDGEHDLHYPTQTAAVIRGLPNALPVSTQRWYHDGAKGEGGRWQDADADEFRMTVAAEFLDIRREILSRYGSIENVYLPEGGLTAGRISQLTEARTPVLHRIINEEAYGLERFVDTVNELTDTVSVKSIPLPVGLPQDGPGRAAFIRTAVSRFLLGENLLDAEGNGYSFGSLLGRYPDEVRQAAAGLTVQEIFRLSQENNMIIDQDMPNQQNNQSPREWFGGLELKQKRAAFSFFYRDDAVGTYDQYGPDLLQRMRDIVSLTKDDPDITAAEAESYLVGVFESLTPEQQRVMMDEVGRSLEEAPSEQEAPAQEPLRKEVPETEINHWVGTLQAYSFTALMTRFPFPDEGVSPAFDAAFDAVSAATAAGWTNGLDELGIIDRLRKVFDGFAPEVKQAFYDEGHRMDLGMQVSDQQAFDVYTLGTSNRTGEEFFGLIPDGVTTVIDVRNYPYNKHQPQFNRTELASAFRAKGISYTHVKALSGKSKDQGALVMGKRDVYDYSKVARTEEFRDAYETLRQTVNASKGKTLIISSEGNPSTSQRALLIGQQLQRDGIAVGHISVDRRGGTERIYSQDAIVRGILGRNKIVDGSTKDIFFESDGTWSAADNVRIVRAQDDVESRLIRGNWNYGREVDVQVDDSGYSSGYTKLARWADFTVVLSAGSSRSPLERQALSAAERNGRLYRIPTDPDELRDPNTARKLADRISEDISRNLLFHYNQNPESVDLNNVKIHVAGTDIARISVKPVTAPVSEEELAGAVKETFRKTGGAEAGFKLDDQTGATQDDVNILVRNILQRLNEKDLNIEFEDASGAYRSPFKITEVRSNGQTGVAEAAINAAQSLGLRAGILAPAGFQHIIDNETLNGRSVNDQAMFLNRFHLGERNAITVDEIQEQVDRTVRQSRDRELDLAPGLTDRQILLLDRLGFSNSDILKMVDIADEHGVVLSPERYVDSDGINRMSVARDLAEFIENCGGYGVDAASFSLSEGTIRAAEKAVDQDIEADRADGIGFLTVNSPDYPEQLRSFAGFTRTEEDAEYRYDPENGVGGVEVVQNEVLEERPAFIRFKGDPRVLNTPTVAVLGNPRSPDEAKRAARMVGRALADGGVTVVSSLHPAAIIGHSVSSIGFLDEEGRFEENGRRQTAPSRTYAREDSQSAAVNETIQDGGSAILFTPGNFDAANDREQIARIVEKGGLVISEHRRGYDPARIEGHQVRVESFMERATRFSSVVAGSAIVIDGTSRRMPGSPVLAAEDASFGRYAIEYPGLEGVYERFAANEEAKRAGFHTVATSGAGLDALIREAAGRAKETVADDIREEAAVIDRNAVIHPDRFAFSVVRRGTEQIFIVPSRVPDVREAVRKTYGADVRFSESLQESVKELRDRQVTVGDTTVSLFNGYTGTQLQEEPVYSVPLFFHKDDGIYSLTSAPDDTPGLASQRIRVEQRRLFEQFKERAVAIQKKFQEAAGFPGAAPIHFENALYPVITPNSVDIFEGDTLRGRVFIAGNGTIRVQNHSRLSDDLQEHAQRKDPFFLNPGGFVDKVAIDSLAIVMEMRLMGTSITEGDMYAVADRESLAEIKEKIEQGWETPSQDNVDVASSDINHGEAAGLLARPGEERYEARDVVKALMRETAMVNKSMKETEKQAARLSKQLEEAQNERNEAHLNGISSEGYKTLDEKIDGLEGDLVSIQDKIASQKARLAAIRDTMKKASVSGNITLLSMEGSKAVVSIDGQAVRLNVGKYAKAVEEESGPLMEKLAAEESSRKKAFDAAVKMEKGSFEADAVARRFDTAGRKASAPAETPKEGYALRSEIKPGTELANGHYIVVRDGKEAYADENLKLTSRFYEKLYPFRTRHGLACEGGKFNYIRPDGTEILGLWIDSISKRSEGFSVVVRDGLYNHVDGKGRFLSEDWCGNCHDFHEGWAVIQAGPNDPEGIRGKYNYVNANGNVMFTIDQWADDAGDFRQGEAVIVRDGARIRIDTEGRNLGPSLDVNEETGRSHGMSH